MKTIVTAAGDGNDGWKGLPFKGEQTLGSQLDKVLKIANEQEFLGKLDLSHDDNGLVEQLEVALYRAQEEAHRPAAIAQGAFAEPVTNSGAAEANTSSSSSSQQQPKKEHDSASMSKTSTNWDKFVLTDEFGNPFTFKAASNEQDEMEKAAREAQWGRACP